jgi:hypothetical protein
MYQWTIICTSDRPFERPYCWLLEHCYRTKNKEEIACKDGAVLGNLIKSMVDMR